MPESSSAHPLAQRIRNIRGHKVMLASDLADLYGVSTKALMQAVRRNLERFPADFAFPLKEQELRVLRSQIVTLDEVSPGRGRHAKYAPYAFTEQGVAMLSSVLKSK
ncbi:MAG: ORF6N domain-containing protein, partial [Chthoniobacteraceae bacterium]